MSKRPIVIGELRKLKTEGPSVLRHVGSPGNSCDGEVRAVSSLLMPTGPDRHAFVCTACNHYFTIPDTLIDVLTYDHYFWVWEAQEPETEEVVSIRLHPDGYSYSVSTWRPKSNRG